MRTVPALLCQRIPSRNFHWVLFVGLAVAPLATLRAVDHVPWIPDLATAQRIAASRNQLILVHFTADECPPCRRLEQNVFSQPQFGHAVGQDYVPVKVNAAAHAELARQWGIQSWPTDVILTPDGKELHRMISPQDPQDYQRLLGQVAWHHRTMAGGGSLASFHPAPQPSSSPMGVPYSAGAEAATHGLASNAPGTSATAPPAYLSAATSPYLTRPERSPTADVAMVAYGQAAAAPAAPTANHLVAGRPETMPSSESRPASHQVAISGPCVNTEAPGSQVIENPYSGGPATSMASPAAAVSGIPAATAASPAIRHDAIPASAQLPTRDGMRDAPMPAATPPDAIFQAVGLDGCCPVTLLETDTWVTGDPRYGAKHRGRVYLFHDAAAQQRFLSAPDKYSPAISGIDPVVLVDQGEFVAGRREHGVRYHDTMFLFSSEEALQAFARAPDRYLQAARQASGLTP